MFDSYSGESLYQTLADAYGIDVEVCHCGRTLTPDGLCCACGEKDKDCKCHEKHNENK